uniref:Uncharacterized protein n=1 Tax=Triticum urartu TaxID=4572 RepID=A0A8R7QY31_TRIUA
MASSSHFHSQSHQEEEEEDEHGHGGGHGDQITAPLLPNRPSTLQNSPERHDDGHGRSSENSPIEQVALTVPVGDDPDTPVLTFRISPSCRSAASWPRRCQSGPSSAARAGSSPSTQGRST